MKNISKNIRQNADRYSVPNLTRALRVMELLSESPRGLGISDIATQLHVPKNSIFRILSTLHIYGYVDRDDVSKTFVLSTRLLSLGYAAVADVSLLEKSSDILRQLRDLVGETALLGTLTRDAGVVLDEVPSKHAIKVQVGVGTKFPLHTAAPAKAILAFLPENEADDLLKRCDFYRFTARTITSITSLRTKLKKIRMAGYAVEVGEELDGVACVGVPVMNYQNRPVAAIWVTGPESRFKADHFNHIGPKVASMVARISERMGYLPPNQT